MSGPLKYHQVFQKEEKVLKLRTIFFKVEDIFEVEIFSGKTQFRVFQ